ncbi:Putative DNA methylase N-4/N-6 [Vibrio nigripulchritudo SFn27]|uniref:Putative DNA methylase N-4/N-6 n=1 Tax=Vibrio nigripulchritudo TaxID=28173 RepID=U4JUL5_9VIBR|nr:site-specific DNA-methyltransferase [Vibrio nigripulchritudo]CCN87519.1 Putative DNA methylase N-4/N-6 [Vibrio nigripulchritudo SFn27]CCO56545.1 Putative DNA methylase N-4/N-6 [Vibrio nigripulchritudo]CCO61675.1 Putative DNA methylase N-4/N-6 [Vibrio nigripulchritudo]
MSNEQTNVEQYEFEPIKGHPMLRWDGKRPFRSTQYFPAQLKEVFGKEDENGWINKIFWGDNLQVMSHLLKEFRGKVDLIYIDPPFDSKADYKKKITLKSKSVKNDMGSFEEKQYTDIWSNDEFLQFMYERLTLMKELLSSTGSIFLHCDYRKSSHLRIMMDEILGPENFKAQICWRSMTSSGFKGKTSLGKSHADILYYSKSENFKYFPVYKPYSDDYIEERFSKVDENGRRFKDEKVGSATPDETIEKWKEEGRIYVTSTGGYRIKHYLDEAKGMIVDDVWTDIYGENSQSKDLTGYPTQKPTALLERIIEMASEANDLVFDCFMGSGTTQAVANKLGRRFIGADINLGAIQTTTKRLARDNASFEVYNVNSYDIFRNPIEAKDLLIEALEIQKLESNTAYDGEKDGYKVKIMPVNRIATKADLDDLIANLPYKQFEARKEAEPNKAVEEIMLVCMGHEPSLAADLEHDILTNGYKVKVKVVDILRDKSDLTFKYDSEASIKTENGKLSIEAFYPRNLLQKLSQQKDDVTEWREMVESIMIDWNYDGAVMEPALIDIPAKNDFVKGEYEIPDGASNIKVKITDLLSESYEEVIIHG